LAGGLSSLFWYFCYWNFLFLKIFSTENIEEKKNGHFVNTKRETLK